MCTGLFVFVFFDHVEMPNKVEMKHDESKLIKKDRKSEYKKYCKINQIYNHQITVITIYSLQRYPRKYIMYDELH